MRMKYGINGKYCHKNMYIVKSHISQIYMKNKPTFFLSPELIASPAILNLTDAMQYFCQRSSPLLMSCSCSGWCSCFLFDRKAARSMFTVWKWGIFSEKIRLVLLKMSGYPVVLNVYDMVCNFTSFLGRQSLKFRKTGTKIFVSFMLITQS